MKIAFDVMGTLEGPKKQLVLKFFKAMKAAGHTCIVWSNSYQYAIDCVKDNNLDVLYQSKTSKSDLYHYTNPEEGMMDLAVEDDRRQTYLAARNFLFVDDISEESIDELITYYKDRI
jgi:hypothetical protein